MYVLLDKEQMVVRYKHPVLRVISDLMHIELAHCSGAAIFIDDHRHLGMFSDLELRILGKNLCGQALPTINRNALVENISTLLKMLPVSNVDPLLVNIQAGLIQSEDSASYQYVPGANQPQKLDGPYLQNALLAPAGFVPVVTSTLPISAPPTPAAALTANNTAPKPQTPKPASVAVSMDAPKTGSKTGLVWQIADNIYNEQTKPVDFKIARRLIITACEAQGINGSTASVQFSKWVKTKT